MVFAWFGRHRFVGPWPGNGRRLVVASHSHQAELRSHAGSKARGWLYGLCAVQCRPALLMGATYRAVLAALERRGWARVDRPVRVSRWRKVGILLRYGVG